MNHACYLVWNSKSIVGFQNAYSSCKENMRGQTSHDKENNATEHMSEKNSVFYRLPCWSHMVIARKEIHWIWLLSFGSALVQECVSFPHTPGNIGGLTAKKVLTNFFIVANSRDGVPSAFAFEFQNGCRTPGVHTLWMKWDKKMSAKLFSCVSSFCFVFFLLGSNVASDLANCITEKSVIYKLLTQSETVNSTKKAISCQKGTADALPCLQA